MTDELAERLEAVLRELVREHEALESLATAHRAAISKMDTQTLRDITRRTGETLERIAALEDARCKALGMKSPTLGEKPAGVPTVQELASVMPEARRERVLELGKTLRSLIGRVKERHAAIRGATDSLTAHMRGLMQEVAAELSNAKTYDPRGRVSPGAAVPAVAGVDVRS